MDNLDIELKSHNEDSRSNEGSRGPDNLPEKFTKIYVGNLPRGTTKESLEGFMCQFGEIERVAIIARGSKNPYGFVTFTNAASYDAALRANGLVFETETLVINKHYPTKEAEDGTREFQRTVFIGNVPRGMSQSDLEKTIFEAISPIKANFRTHHTLRPVQQPGMKLIKTGDSGCNPDLKMCAFLVFQSLAEAEQAGNILFDLELGDERFIVEFSKGRKINEYRKNACRILHIGNIPLTATEEEITRKFRLYGELSQVRLISDRSTGLSKGYAFIDFKKAADAQHAVAVLAGTKWDGQDFIVQFEKNEKRRVENEKRRSGRSDNRPFRRKRSFTPEGRRKRRRSLTPRRRSPSIRRSRETSRDEIYNYKITPERRYESDLPRRSMNEGDGNEVTLFVSNLPNAPEHRVRYLLEQLAGPMVLFRKQGSDGWLTYEDHRCAMLAHDILRDHRIEGIRLVVEVLESRPPARVVDDGYRLREPPLPVKMLPREPNHVPRDSRGWSDEIHSTRREPERLNGYEDPYPERKYNDHPPKRARTTDMVEGNKLFIGNLSLELSKAELTRLFDKYGQIESVKLPTKEGKSTRYGFVNYIYPEDAAAAQRDLDGYMLQGRRMRVEISTSKAKLGRGPPRNTGNTNRRTYDKRRGRNPPKGHDIWVRDPEKR